MQYSLLGITTVVLHPQHEVSLFLDVRAELRAFVLCDFETKPMSGQILWTSHSKVNSASCLCHDVQPILPVLPSDMSTQCSHLKNILVMAPTQNNTAQQTHGDKCFSSTTVTDYAESRHQNTQ